MISSDRLKHINAVAQYMYDKAEDGKKEEMYLLGMLHDIGYLYAQKGHNVFGGNILKEQGYKYWQEVYYHGEPISPYKSDELDFLNSADMSVDSKGNLVGHEQRLNDIGDRYGYISDEYINAKKVIDNLPDKYK